MINRRQFVAIGAGALLAPLMSARAECAPKAPSVGFLALIGVSTERQMRATLRDLGYVDGKNIVIHRRSANGAAERLPALAEELVQLKVDVVVATGPGAVQAATAATHSIPIVALDLETDPVKSGLVQSLGRPGGNLTGFFLDLPEIAGKWCELLKSAAPAVPLVGVLWDSTSGKWQLRAAQSAAKRLGLDLYTIEVQSADNLDSALRIALDAGVKAIIALSSPMTSAASPGMADFMRRNGLPGIAPFRAFAERGGLMSYGPNLVDLQRRATEYVDRVLKGTKPDELPIQQPTKFEFVVNMKTAKALGLTISQALLLRADEVIQ